MILSPLTLLLEKGLCQSVPLVGDLLEWDMPSYNPKKESLSLWSKHGLPLNAIQLWEKNNNQNNTINFLNLFSSNSLNNGQSWDQTLCYNQKKHIENRDWNKKYSLQKFNVCQNLQSNLNISIVKFILNFKVIQQKYKNKIRLFREDRATLHHFHSVKIH